MMWFDVQAALAEVDPKPTASPSRVAHVAHVARPPAQESETWPIDEKATKAGAMGTMREGRPKPGAIAGTGFGATVTYALLDRLSAKGRLVTISDELVAVAHRMDDG